MEICDLGCVCQSLVCIALLQVHACKLDWIMRIPQVDSGASWCRVAVLLLTLCLMNESGSAIPFEEFVGYPFDESSDHTAFPRELNLVRGLFIPVPFPYFGRTFSYVHVSALTCAWAAGLYWCIY